MALLTPWRGVFYNQDFSSRKVWYHGGTFDLRVSISPIFVPPRPHSAGIHAVVRWPWQAPDHHEMVELAGIGIVAEAWLGSILIGLIFGRPIAIAARRRPDLFLQSARAIAYTQIVAAPCCSANSAASTIAHSQRSTTIPRPASSMSARSIRRTGCRVGPWKPGS